MENTTRSNVYNFSRAFLMVFSFVMLYVMLSILFTVVFGNMLGSIIFLAALVGLMSVPAWSESVLNKLNKFADSGAEIVERVTSNIASLFKRKNAETPAAEPAPAA